MAVVAELFVPHATQSEFDPFDVSVSGAIEQMGGPPAGLMAHFVRPSGDGFVICNVWRTAEDMHSFYDAVLLPLLATAGMVSQEPTVSPVWSFARP